MSLFNVDENLTAVLLSAMHTNLFHVSFAGLGIGLGIGVGVGIATQFCSNHLRQLGYRS